MPQRRRHPRAFFLTVDPELAHFFYEGGAAHPQALRGMRDDAIRLFQRLHDQHGFELGQVLLQIHPIAGQSLGGDHHAG